MADVDRAVERIARIAGPGSQARRRELVSGLFAAATADEQAMLLGLFGGAAAGCGAGLVAEAVARAAGVPPPAVRRALLLTGDLKQVARAALTGGAAALHRPAPAAGHPIWRDAWRRAPRTRRRPWP